jgi:hypothetical protein
MAGKVQVARRERLLRLCKSIIADPSIVDDDIKAQFESAVLKYVHTQYDDPTRVLKRLYHDEGELGCLLRKAADRFINKELDDEGADDRERDDDGGDDDTKKRVDHQASTVANLLVEAGSALQHLLHKPSGQALLRRMHKAAEQTEKESNMRSETLESILKDSGSVSVCKAIVDRGRSPCGEHELVAALTKAASEQFNMPGDRAFSKLFEAEESVRRACNIAKAAEFSVFDIKPVVVGGTNAQDVNNATAAVRAREEIERIGREKFPFLPADQQFSRVFEDKNYAALAAQAHRRPGPTTIYEMPGSTGPGRGAYTKADPAPSADTAYAELMVKAEAYRSAHSDLSIAQCFAEIYTDRANVELAKRERIESVPR